MAVGLYAWSTTANSNGSADANINFAEGQSPPSLNNSARAMMAALKSWFDAFGGAVTYGGSSNAYTATNSAPGAWSAYAAGQVIALKANHTNTGAATLAVDGLTAKTIKTCDGGDVVAGDLVSGGIYLLAYDGTNFQVLNTIGGGSYQPLDATLTALAALSYTSGTLYLTMTGADTFALGNDATLVKTTGTQTIGGAKTLTADLTLSYASPAIYLTETDASANAGKWLLNANSDQMAAYAVNDALGAFNPIFVLSRSGATPTAFNVSSGVALQSNGVAVRVAGKTAIPIPASAMIANTTNGPSSGTTETTTNKVMYRTLDFDQTTAEYAQFLIPMPKGWNEGTVTFQPVWTAASGSGGVLWAMDARAFSDDDTLDAAFGGSGSSADTLLATGDCHVGPESAAITIAGSPAEGDLVAFRVYRYPADAGDTLAADAKLIAIRLFITTNAANDS